jgi:hypothetical protein
MAIIRTVDIGKQTELFPIGLPGSYPLIYSSPFSLGNSRNGVDSSVGVDSGLLHFGRDDLFSSFIYFTVHFTL